MRRASTRMLKTALSALHYSGLGSLAAPVARGRGVIFTLHQVQPGSRPAFDPNGILCVTPEFLGQVIRQVRDAGFQIVSIDEAARRMAEGESCPAPFAAFTFDDGYRDNLTFAYPVLRQHRVPFTVYVACDFADGVGELWWLALEAVVRRCERLSLDMDGKAVVFDCSTTTRKQASFDCIYWWLRGLPEDRMRRVVRTLAADADVDVGAPGRDLMMDWDEIRTLAADPLVTIGGHGCRHYALAKLPADDVRREIADCVRRIEAEIGKPCRHFCFPYGDETSASARDFAIAAELGLATAVTTRKGVIKGGYRESLTGLPRISLNGEYQHRRYVDVMLTGVPFMLLDLLRRDAQPAR